MADEFDSMLGMIMTMTMVFVMGAFAMSIVQASQPQFCCPFCNGVCFYTVEELESHFASEHPGEPIDITWD